MSRAYPTYRDSGVEWLGDVPAHWEVQRIKHVAEYHTSTVDKKTEDGELPVRLCNYIDVYYRERIRSDDGEFMEATASPREVARFKLNVGDILVTKDSEDWRDIAVPALVEETADDFVCGYHLGIIRPGSTAHPRFLFRAMQSVSVNEQLQTYASGVTRYGLPNAAVSDTTIAVPPLPEQHAIAAFLDRETERIDALVAKQQLLIERLEEYRSALITRTVTRGLPPEAARAAGLDPSPRLKPSGVEWLGGVPEHWEVLPLRRRIIAIKDGTHGTYDRVDNGVPLLSAKNIIDGQVFIGPTESLISDEDADRITASGFPRRGDVLLTIVGSIGRTAVFDEATPLPFQRSVAFLRFRPEQPPDYIRWVLESRPAQDQMTNMVKMAAQGGVYLEDVVGIVGPFPPPVEQRAIAAFLDRENDQVDELSGRIETDIERLQEYRTALITAAVTGKIDVRESARAQLAPK